MAPSYQPGARVSTSAISRPLQRGDVVVIDDGGDGYAVKRIVGLPGESVHVWRGHVFINDLMLEEPYLPKNTFTYPIERRYLGAAFTVEADHYFVLGDNRPESTDSRAYGPVRRERIKRLVPLPKSFTRAHLTGYTLPPAGKALIRPL
jgi:signal peptidase I